MKDLKVGDTVRFKTEKEFLPHIIVGTLICGNIHYNNINKKFKIIDMDGNFLLINGFNTIFHKNRFILCSSIKLPEELFKMEL